MEIPVGLNLSLGSSSGSLNEPGAGGSKLSNDRGFSEHFDDNVNRLKDAGKKTSKASSKRLEESPLIKSLPRILKVWLLVQPLRQKPMLW